MSGYQTKDANGNPTPEPEVVKAVLAQVEKLGENTKANYDELRKNHESLKKLVDEKGTSMDAETKAQITKLSEDITVRQNAIDKKVAEAQATIKVDIDAKLTELATKRIDAIETAIKRLPKENPSSSAADTLTETKQFVINAAANKNKGDKAITPEEIDAMEFNVDEYKAYTKAFRSFLRRDERMNISTTPEHLKALSVGIDPDGGYTVTPAMSNRMIKRIYEADPIRQLAATESITTGALEWMVDFDEAGWGWEAETIAGGETATPQLFKKRIPVHVMYAKPRASQTLLEDSGINIENWLSDKVSNRFLRGEGAAFVNGDGVGKPRGFTTYGNYTTAGVDEWGKVEQINMKHATNITADGFIAVKYALIEAYLQRGTWVMNRLTVAETMYLKDGVGNYLWKPGFAEDKYATILNLPVRMSTTMPLHGVAGRLPVALADWAEAYMIVDRLGITIQRDPFTVKPMIEFYTRKRVGADCVNYQAIKLGVMAV